MAGVAFVEYRIQTTAIHDVVLVVTAMSQEAPQGSSLAFYVNTSASGFSFTVDGMGYLGGLALEYLGTHPPTGANPSPLAGYSLGRAPYVVGSSSPRAVATWNGTLGTVGPNGLSFALAPAGYYLVTEGSATQSSSGPVRYSYEVATPIVSVPGVSANLSFASNATPYLSLGLFQATTPSSASVVAWGAAAPAGPWDNFTSPVPGTRPIAFSPPLAPGTDLHVEVLLPSGTLEMARSVP